LLMIELPWKNSARLYLNNLIGIKKMYERYQSVTVE
jgi:hypothetical protein